MTLPHDENDRPIEWLNALAETPDGYRSLLDGSDSLAVAAHRLATARCRVCAVPTVVPTATELSAAALEISQRADLPGRLPTSASLALECERSGLPVIGARRAA
jgi:hypothetical protein